MGSRKVMFLIDVYEHPYAGTERQLYSLIEGLQQKGIKTELTLFRDSNYVRKNGFPCPVNVLDIRQLFSLVAIKRIISFAKYLSKEKFDLVHIFFNDSSIIAPFFVKLFGRKVIISRRDMGYWYNRSNIYILRLSRFFVDAVVVNSQAVKMNTHKREHIPLNNISVIYNGFRPFHKSNSNTVPDQDFPFFPGNPPIIGLLANIRPVKRIDLLVSAFALVNREFSESKLVIIGAGSSRCLERLADDLEVGHDVHFLGGRNDVNHLIKQFDVAVLCSDSEGFSNSIIEYIQAMIPVVCTDVGGNSEIIEHNETGYLVPPDNIEELAHKICMVLSNPAHAEKMAQKAKARISQLCHYETMLEKHIELYNKICRQ